jgi:hypothetical protein
LKNFTVPTGIKSFLSRFLLNAPALIELAVTSQVFGSSLERSPKPGAWQQVEAENQVAGGDLDGFRRNVNGSAADWRCQITFYEFVTASR